MKKISNSSELSRYYSDVNKYIDEYIKTYKVTPSEIFRYINKNMSKFLEKFGIKDVENIDRVVKDVIEHRRNMERDKIYRFEQFSLRLDESIISIQTPTVDHEKILADYFNTSIGHIEALDPNIHLYQIKDFETIIRTIIFSEQDFQTMKSKLVDLFIDEISKKEVELISLNGNLLENSFSFILSNVVSEERLRSNIEMKLTEKIVIDLITQLIPNRMNAFSNSFCKFKGSYKGYYLWEV